MTRAQLRLNLPKACLAALLIAAALSLFAACAKNPVSGQDEFVLMSEQQELAMGARYYPQTTQLNNGVVPNDPALQQYVSRLGNRLAALSHRPNLPWQFNVVNSSKVNAFALPGGKISVTRGLLLKMQNEDQLASVLGHEIGHVTARHAVNQYTNTILLNVALAGAAIALSDNDYAPALLAAAGVAGNLIMLSYSRDQERQADELGYVYMTKAGYNPKAAVDVFYIFKGMQKSQPSAVAALLSSHPLPAERITAAQKRAAQASPRLTNRPYHAGSYQQALARQQQRAKAYAAMDVGNALASKGRYGQAATYFQRAVALYPNEGLFHSRLALTYLAQGKKNAALNQAVKGLKLSGKNFYGLLIYSAVQRSRGNYQMALKGHRIAAGLMPGHVVNTYYIAYCYDRLGQRRNAAAYYNQVYRSSAGSKYGKSAKARLMGMGYKFK